MDSRLKDLLDVVARRLRRQRFCWLIAPACLIAALVGFVLLLQYREGVVSQESARIGTGMTFVLALLGAWILSLCSFRNSKKVAMRIESRFPKLRQRLLTAVDQRPGLQGKPLSFLQAAVIDDAIRHGKTHPWTFAVNDGLTRLAWLLNVPAMIMLLVVGFNLMSQSVDANSHRLVNNPAVEPSPEAEITVEPGDIEIERRTNLVVVARFGDESTATPPIVPSEVSLVAQLPDSSVSMEMRRNLKDPVFGGYLSEVATDLEYHIQYDQQVTRSYKVTVFDYPRLERSDAKLVFPQYTGLSEKLVEDTRRVVAVEGSELTWICHLNKPVEKAELVDESGDSMPLEPLAGSLLEYRITIALEKTARWTLKLTDDRGRENKHPPELIARVSPNRPPVLKLVSARDVRVSPLEELEVGASFQDDYGMQQYGLTYSMAGSESNEIVLGESTRRKEKREVTELIDFEALQAEPDQLLSFYFWAEDIAPDGNPRQVQSDMFFAEVRHFEEIFRQGQQSSSQPQQQQQQSQTEQRAEQLAELQKQIITGTWNLIRRQPAKNPAALSKFVDDVDLLKESQETALAQLEELAQEVSDAQSQGFIDAVREFMQKAVTELASVASSESPEGLSGAISVEQAAYQGLLKLRAREFEVSQQQQSQSQQQQQQNQQNRQRFQQQLNELELKNDENRYETQQQAQQEQDEQDRELRQVLNRLRELARRQEDINKQLKQLQSALEQAETDEEREEIERQLKRLREEQQELLRDTDELSERMDQPETHDALSEQQEQLEQTRENVRESSEALAQKDVSQALSAGTRAEREFKRMRDDVRQQAAGEFEEAMRQMREKVQELDEDQQQLGDQISDLQEPSSSALRSPQDRDEIRESIEQQQERLGELLQNMERTVEEAELTEPLLAENLYDSFRKTRQRQLEQKLETTNQLLERGLDPQAAEIEESAQLDITKLREEIDKASESVLGDPTESLRRALGELDDISRQLNDEIRRNDPSGEPQSEPRESKPSSSSEATENQGQLSDDSPQQQSESQESSQNSARSGQPQEGQPQQGQPQEGQPQEGQPQQGQPQEGQPQQGQPQQGQPQQGQPQQASPHNQQSENPSRSSQATGQPQAPGQQSQSGGGRGVLDDLASSDQWQAAAPLTGDDYREWSDRLRDIEEMVEDPELRSQAVRIREAAREVRIELKRHSKSPQWNLVREMIAKPLEELKQQVSDELLRRSADRNALVPIDRDPVPKQFADQVRKYYEKLGTGR